MNYASELIKVAEAEVGYLEKETNKNLDSKTANVNEKTIRNCLKENRASRDGYRFICPGGDIRASH